MSKSLTKKERYVKEVRSHLQQALNIVDDVNPDSLSLQELKAAGTQAAQASCMLHRLEGMVESEQGD